MCVFGCVRYIDTNCKNPDTCCIYIYIYLRNRNCVKSVQIVWLGLHVCVLGRGGVGEWLGRWVGACMHIYLCVCV